jgi:hypothetical protein
MERNRAVATVRRVDEPTYAAKRATRAMLRQLLIGACSLPANRYPLRRNMR